AQAALSKVTALLDKMARKNTISKNKAANLKSKLQKHVNSLAA
ncbi:MAG: 30S ribosomal protein S20, partial [Muribaculaceae bacterium]|nr:30S ribosomal protein S20 [Muribaculaceae bacterium]